ncbi:MAG: ABC transporter substrate-binding protein [Candidatus Pacebacteria bacterium]|jgi:peptide/nickel transport system substrate-binding protein|nr:ABC transporter substrate-binding protein [Candidatus Paceibacterota bacterium]MBT4652141.1 ABC transporter substrate-binding protein [Candidatus Paceibacterota bacterium]MBT6756679.1 ABC transporter substrate-binding protein [Candidatus Paceibacterota bacterium]MBT6920776.1 ABC transporter substrate-binding protein [Candidatus Paceibacterota bacterium]
MRRLYWYITAYTKKHGWVFLGSLVGAIVIFSLFIPFLVDKVTLKQKEYIGIIGSYSLENLPTSIKKQLSVGLTQITESKEVQPHLSQRWVVEDDGKQYRFVLKQNVNWQDGKEVTPEDIQYQFVDVETVATPNDIVFKLPDAFSPFPSVLSEPIFRQGTEKYLWFFSRPTLIGIGSNRITDYVKKGNRLKQITVETPEKKLVYRFYLTETDLLYAFKRGEIDVIPDLSDAGDLEDWKNVEITPVLHTERYLAVFFNNADSMMTKNVRQALSYGLESPKDGTQARGPIDPTSWAYLEGGKTYDKDLDRAIERLLDDMPRQPLELNLTTTQTFGKEAEDIIAQWTELGERAVEKCQDSSEVKEKDLCSFLQIKVNLKVSSFPDTNDFQLLLIGQESLVDPDQYFLWHSDQPTNFTRYKNTRIDSLLEKARTTIDQDERKALYQEFQQFLLEDPPAIFLRHLYSYEVKRK